MPDDKLKKMEDRFERLLGFLDVENTKEFEELITLVIKVVQETKVHLEKCMASDKSEMTSHMEGMAYEMKESELRLQKMVTESRQSSVNEAKTLAKQLSDEIRKVKESMPQMPDLTGLEARIDSIVIPSIDDIEADLPRLGTSIRDGLELLQGDERLDKSAVKGIEDIERDVDELKNRKGNTVYVGGGSSGGGRIVKVYDISSQLNGVTKTFTLPAFWRIVSVQSSYSVPNTFLPTTHYTSDASAMTITFTSEIEASTTLAAGQGLLVIYAE